MWTKTAKKFRRSKSAAGNADAEICKNNSLPVAGAEEFAIVGKTPSADDANISTMIVEQINKGYDAHPDVCKNNSSSTESQMTMSHGPSGSGEEEGEEIALVSSSASDKFASEDDGQHDVEESTSGEEECEEIAQVPSKRSDEFESDDEGDDGQRNAEDTISAEQVVVTAITDKDTFNKDTSCIKPASEASAQPDETTQAENLTKCTRMCQGLESMMLERVNSINEIRKVLRNEIKMDSGKFSSFDISCLTLSTSQ